MPRLRKYTDGLVVYAVIPCEPYWVCFDEWATGFGATPKDAYADWLNDSPKTFIRRIGRKLVNWII